MKELINNYINDKISLEKYQKVGILLLIIVFSGIFGYIYEFIFYFFNGGMKQFYLQGGNFLPWINIYAIGAVLVFILTKKLKKNPLIVFIMAVIITGLLEYFSGLVIYKLFNGLRLWDYNTEILNFGNIGGFVCLRSVIFFGISSLLLIYFIIPIFIIISKKMSKKAFLILSISLCTIFLADEFYNLVITKIFSLPTAVEIYKSFGFVYG